ncbi:ribonuclease P protein component 1 [Candidatus Bathyarchaeota archaeon]|nr:ribonuclease P protein component 1 [Candidatus Bathyarchaeota archaeon]TRO48160.1 ribonuclease P protein component 1 [Candidatus Bathyarchaeota archaeon]
MKVTPDIIRHEFIGTEGKIAKSPHADYIGICGEVIDETKNTFMILQKAKTKSVVKNSTVFYFKFSDGTIVEIDGKLLVGRPEDRLKKTVKRLW